MTNTLHFPDDALVFDSQKQTDEQVFECRPRLTSGQLAALVNRVEADRARLSRSVERLRLALRIEDEGHD